MSEIPRLQAENLYISRNIISKQAYKSGSYIGYDIKYHIVWITKYRRPILDVPASERIRELKHVCKMI